MTAVDVTVAISVKDGVRYLAEAIESVLAQEGVALELVVRDNGSTDGSFELAERYAAADPRVAAVRNERDFHYYGSLNRALEEARGEFFAIFACDDRMLPGNLRAKVEGLRASDGVLAHSPAYVIGGDGNRRGYGPPVGEPGVEQAPGFARRIMPSNIVTCPSAVVRTSTFRALGGFDTRTPLCGDWLAWLQLSLRGAVATLDEPLVEYRTHDENASNDALSSGRFAAEETAVMRAIFRDPAFPPEWRSLEPDHVARRKALCALLLMRSGRLRVADGVAAYGVAADALVEAPPELVRDVAQLHSELAAAARIPVPSGQFSVASAVDAATAPAFVRLCSGLARNHMLGSAVAVCRDDDAGAVVDVLERELEAAPDVELDLIPGARLEELVERGYAVAASYGSEDARLAEGRGRLVFPYPLPDPLAA